jgi:hypothetical protein
MIRWTFLVILPLAVSLAVAADSGPADDLQSLSGTLKEGDKSEFKYFLQLDGMTGSMNVSGDVLKDFKPGDRVWVKGVIKTRFLKPKPDGTPQQQPIHWVIFMEAREAKIITTPFGL